MITLVDVSAHTAVQNVLRQPGERFFGIRLRRAAEVSKFRSIDAGEADVDLLTRKIRSILVEVDLMKSLVVPS